VYSRVTTLIEIKCYHYYTPRSHPCHQWHITYQYHTPTPLPWLLVLCNVLYVARLHIRHEVATITLVNKICNNRSLPLLNKSLQPAGRAPDISTPRGPVWPQMTREERSLAEVKSHPIIRLLAILTPDFVLPCRLCALPNRSRSLLSKSYHALGVKAMTYAQMWSTSSIL